MVSILKAYLIIVIIAISLSNITYGLQCYECRSFLSRCTVDKPSNLKECPLQGTKKATACGIQIFQMFNLEYVARTCYYGALIDFCVEGCFYSDKSRCHKCTTNKCNGHLKKAKSEDHVKCVADQ